MSMSQRSIAAYTTRRPYDSTPFRSHARSGSELPSETPKVRHCTSKGALDEPERMDRRARKSCRHVRLRLASRDRREARRPSGPGQWAFYVVPTVALPAGQNSIGLAGIEALTPVVQAEGLAPAVRRLLEG